MAFEESDAVAIVQLVLDVRRELILPSGDSLAGDNLEAVVIQVGRRGGSVFLVSKRKSQSVPVNSCGSVAPGAEANARLTAISVVHSPVEIVQSPSLGTAPTLTWKSSRRALVVRLLPVLESTVAYDIRPSL